jgi:Ca2+:H+ antiporter
MILTHPQIVYLIIAVAAWYYPDPDVATTNGIEDAVAKSFSV